MQYYINAYMYIHAYMYRTVIKFHFVVNYFRLLNLVVHGRKFILFIKLCSGELSRIRVSVKKKRKNVQNPFIVIP